MTEPVDQTPFSDSAASETLKVLREWLSPQEYAGFLKGRAIEYQLCHTIKGSADDLAKGLWYSVELVRFVAEKGHGLIWPRADDGVLTQDEVDALVAGVGRDGQ